MGKAGCQSKMGGRFSGVFLHSFLTLSQTRRCCLSRVSTILQRMKSSFKRNYLSQIYLGFTVTSILLFKVCVGIAIHLKITELKHRSLLTLAFSKCVSDGAKMGDIGKCGSCLDSGLQKVNWLNLWMTSS